MPDETEKDYTEKVTDALIKQLKQGVAPWQKPWSAGEKFLPYNPKSAAPYQGANALWLMALQQAMGYQDTRWLTYKQAADMGAHVKKGEKGAALQFWQWSENKTMVGPDGQENLQSVKLDRPRVKNFVVFNAEQITGLAKTDQRNAAPERERHKAAETIIANSGASIQHRLGNRAFYNRKTDQITMPLPGQFETQDGYYVALLQWIGSWSGHPDRLDREGGNNPFGSGGHAREELRVQLASLIIGDALGMGHDPSQHAAYTGNWVAILEEDPREIFRAAADAGTIAKFVLGLEQHRHLSTAVTLADQVRELPKRQNLQHFAHRTDTAAANLLLYGSQQETGAIATSAQDEFANVLKGAGFKLTAKPIMDGNTHRVPVEGDKGRERSGAYAGYLDGRPAGWFEDYRNGERQTWKAQSVPSLSAVERASLVAEAGQKREARQEEIEAQNDRAAGKAAAKEIAMAVGGLALLPTFEAGLDGVGWNDVAIKEGQDGLNRELRDGINREQQRNRQERLDEHEKPKGLAERTEDRLATMQDAANEFNINRTLMSSALRPNATGAQVEAPSNIALAESTPESPKQTHQQVRRIAR